MIKVIVVTFHPKKHATVAPAVYNVVADSYDAEARKIAEERATELFIKEHKIGYYRDDENSVTFADMRLIQG